MPTRPSSPSSSASPGPGGASSVRGTTRSATSLNSGSATAASCRATGLDAFLGEACQRQTQIFALPVRRMISTVPIS